MKKRERPCVHCGEKTMFAWVDSRTPDDNVIPVCISCMNDAEIGSYASAAYERVGQKTYRPLLQAAKK